MIDGAMTIRSAVSGDADALAAIYAPVVRDTAISFEFDPPDVEEMRARVINTLKTFPWLVSIDDRGEVDGYAYASRHRDRAAYQWSVDCTAYVRQDRRGRGVGKSLYLELFKKVARLGYFQAFAGITLPNEPSVALHKSVGFELVGIYRAVGFKHGAWHDVSWWQKRLRPAAIPQKLRSPDP
jgi:L-amino acid N-acyltransferase YncA